jgi:hypothetical protein
MESFTVKTQKISFTDLLLPSTSVIYQTVKEETEGWIALEDLYIIGAVCLSVTKVIISELS